ncbi:MAG: dockerin type I repeat-containing protein, partial [Oscillospiraceae bacterium]|nr:dockerin type I repeat-containing protein [Oscillospiraceae bacterium]
MLKKKMLATVMAILCCAQTNLALPCIADYVQVDVIPDQTILTNPEDASSVQKRVQELVEIRNVLETYIKEETLSVEPMQIETWDILEDKPIPAEEITLIVGCETEEVADQIKNFLQEKQIDTSHVLITWKMPTFEEPIVPVDDLHEMKIMLSNYTLNHGLEAMVRTTETQVKIICQSQSAYDHMIALVEEKQLNQKREMVICVLELPVIDPGTQLATDPTEESTTEPNPVLELTPIKKIEIKLGNYIRENGVAAHINSTETQIEVACESQEIYDHMSAWVKEQKFNEEQNIVICTLADPINTDGCVQASDPDPVEPPTNPVLELTPIKKIEIMLGNYIRENVIAAHINNTGTQIEVACESQEIYDHMSAWVKEQRFNEEQNIVICTLADPINTDGLIQETELPADFDIEKYNSVIGGLNRYIKENNISAYAGGDTDLRLEQVKVVCKTEEAYQQMLAFVEQEKYNQDVDDIVVFEMRNLVVTSSDSEEKEEVKLGDVSENGEVDIIDVIMINKSILGQRKLTKSQSGSADIDKNGIVE